MRIDSSILPILLVVSIAYWSDDQWKKMISSFKSIANSKYLINNQRIRLEFQSTTHTHTHSPRMAGKEKETIESQSAKNKRKTKYCAHLGYYARDLCVCVCFRYVLSLRSESRLLSLCNIYSQLSHLSLMTDWYANQNDQNCFSEKNNH